MCQRVTSAQNKCITIKVNNGNIRTTIHTHLFKKNLLYIGQTRENEINGYRYVSIKSELMKFKQLVVCFLLKNKPT